MKQILQSLKTGSTEVAQVPCPAVKREQLLIRSSHTLVSAGTERMVLDKIKTDGLMPTGNNWGQIPINFNDNTFITLRCGINAKMAA